MADKTITYGTEGAEDVARAMEDVARSSEEADKSLGKTAQTSDQTSASAGELKTSLLAVGAALGAVAVAAKETVLAFAEQDAANGRLKRSMRQAGAGSGAFARAQARMKQNVDDLGLSMLEQTDALRKLTDASGDHEAALSDLQLAADIAAQENVALSQATETLAKARRGDTAALKRLNAASADQVKELNKVEDESERTAIAIQFLTEKYGGAAAENAGLIDRMATTEERAKELATAVGDTAAAIGEGTIGLVGAMARATGVLEEGADPLRTITGAFKNFAGAIRETTGELEKVVENFGDLLSGEKTVFEIISEADSAAARADFEKKQKKARQTGGSEFVGPVQTEDSAAERLAKAGEGGGTVTPPKRRAKAQEEEKKSMQDHFAEMRQLQRLQDEKQAEIDAENRERDLEATQEHNEKLAEIERARRMAEIDAVIEAEEKKKEVENEARKAEKKRRAAQLEAGQAVGDAAAGIAGQLIEAEGARLAVESLATSARAAVLFAKALAPPDPITGAGPQNLPGAIATAAAAVQLGIAAAKAGKGGGATGVSKPSGGGGAASAGASAGSRPAPESVELLGERDRRQQDVAQAPLTININSAFPPDPSQARDLFDAVEEEKRRRV